MTSQVSMDVDRRTVLGGLAGLGSVSVAGCSLLDPADDDPATRMEDETARELATRFGPTIYFDRHERWFPTDPRPYTSEQDGETVVDGFDALNGYHERYSDGAPPDPTVFYHGMTYEGSTLGAIQFWCYSVFDQFTSNFHWHDWEVVHVFVDTATGDPQLYVASAHARSVPNNEFLDPDPAVPLRLLPELGSHSGTLSVNDVPDRFQRVAVEDVFADITNTTIEGIEDLVGIPLAYGLPRDEGMALPFLVPELEGAVIYDHARLPAVTRESLITDELTIRSFDALRSPPTGLPLREPGLVFQPRDGAGDADVEYELVPTSELEHIRAFTGPQLSFEFAVPQLIEDAISSHITTTGTPWEQPRYTNPAADITASNHRAVLADRYDVIGEPAPINSVVAYVTQTATTEDAPEDEGLTTIGATVESLVLFESDPEAIPTFGGVAIVLDVPPGEHRLTVNGAGRAPHAENIDVSGDGGMTPAGISGEIPLTAHENATKLEIGGENAEISLSRVAIEDDFAGRLYDAPVSGNDAVYVHTGGAYAVEVRDGEDEIGAHRVNPERGANGPIKIERPETGKASLAAFVADITEETRGAVAELVDGGESSSNAVAGLERALAAVVEAARMAAERARDGERGNADRQLDTVVERLQRVENRLLEAREDLPDPLLNAANNRMEQIDRRVEQAKNAEKL